MHPIIGLIHTILGLYSLAVFIYVITTLLIQFKIINSSQQLVAAVTRFLAGITEPVLQKIRVYIKPINGFDISPVVLLLAITFLQECLEYYF